MTDSKPRRGASVAERILFHVDRSGECWIWQSSTMLNGYGQIKVARRNRLAHRVSYETFVGPIPEGLHLDHLCRVRACVNPAHLEPVTCRENLHRSPLTKASVTACPYGHSFDADNTYIRSMGHRACRACDRTRRRIRRAMTPAQVAARKAAGLPVVDLAGHFAGMERAA